MAQQPNIEIQLEDLPRRELEPAPPRRWAPSRPGDITAPSQVPAGPDFGRPGPDPGYALRVIRQAGLGPLDSNVEALIAAVVTARAAAFGRGPTAQDLEVAMALTGLDPAVPEAAKVLGEERRQRWAEAAAHEKVKGRMALAEIDPDLLMLGPTELRHRLAAFR